MNGAPLTKSEIQNFLANEAIPLITSSGALKILVFSIFAFVGLVVFQKGLKYAHENMEQPGTHNEWIWYLISGILLLFFPSSVESFMGQFSSVPFDPLGYLPPSSQNPISVFLGLALVLFGFIFMGLGVYDARMIGSKEAESSRLQKNPVLSSVIKIFSGIILASYASEILSLVPGL